MKEQFYTCWSFIPLRYTFTSLLAHNMTKMSALSQARGYILLGDDQLWLWMQLKSSLPFGKSRSTFFGPISGLTLLHTEWSSPIFGQNFCRIPIGMIFLEMCHRCLCGSLTNWQSIILEWPNSPIPTSCYNHQPPCVGVTKHVLARCFQKPILGFAHCWWYNQWAWSEKLLLWPGCRSLGEGLREKSMAHREMISGRKWQYSMWALTRVALRLFIFWARPRQVYRKLRWWKYSRYIRKNRVSTCCPTPRYSNWSIVWEKALTRPIVLCLRMHGYILADIVPDIDIRILTCWDYMHSIWGERCRYLTSCITDAWIQRKK